MKKTNPMQILLISLIILLPGLCQGQLVYDIKQQPEGKQRNIRTGESLEAIRANALQTMDFGLEIMGDVLKMTNHLEHIVIFRWEETRDKYLSLWRNTWDWFATSMAEKKMDLTKHKEWQKKYDTFLDSVVSDGEAVVYWKWREEIFRKNLDYDIRDIPKEITELKNSVKEANTLLGDALALAGKGEIDSGLDKVQMAENLLDKISKYIEKTQDFVKKEREKKKSSLDSAITQVRDRLKACTANNPDVMNRYSQRVAKWAGEVDTFWEYYKKSWLAWEEVVKPVMGDNLFTEYSFFKGVKYSELTKVTERARLNLQGMK